MAKLQFNHDILTPVTPVIHNLLELSGYALVEQRTMYMEYTSDIRRIIFNGLNFISYDILCEAEDDRAEEWSNMFSGAFGYMTDDIDVIYLLHLVGAIDLKGNPAFIAYLKHAKNGRKSNSNGSDMQDNSLPFIGGNTGFFGLRKGKGTTVQTHSRA